MTKSLTVNQENTAASRGFLTTGVGFVADVLSLLDVFDDMPDIEDVATEVYEHWEEEMKYLEEILEGQLEIKDLINDVIEMGEQMEQDILDALETGLNDINGQINDVDDHIEQMQEDILQAMSAFYEAVMVQFEEVKLNQQYMTAQLKAIEEMLMEISGEVEKLSAKIDWDGVVSLSGVHIQRIEYLYDSLSHIPQVEEGDGGYVDSPVIDADQVNYFRLRQWATSVMDYNNGTPLAEDALDRLIMGKMILTNSMINLLIKLLQQDAFPTGGRSRTQVVQEYYENLAMIQVKGFMCVDVACNILRIRNPYEELVEQRINDQLDFVVAALDESGFDPLELIPAPTEGDRKTVYYGDKADHSLSIDLADPAMGLDNPEEWCILNMIPFIDDARKGEVSVCVGKLLPGYKIDYATVEWMDYKTSDADPFWLEHAASAISGAGSIFADAVRIPDERIASCFTFAYISNQITIKATHNPYDPELGTWDSSLPATEEATGSRTVSEGSLGYWLNNPVSSVSDLPLMALGFLVSTNDTENCLEVSFQTSRVGGEALPPLPEIESPVRQEYKDSPQTGAAEYGSVDESSAYFEYDTEGTFTVHLERSGLTDYPKPQTPNPKPQIISSLKCFPPQTRPYHSLPKTPFNFLPVHYQ